MSIALHTLEEVLHPRSVAILGASRAPRKWRHVAAKRLLSRITQSHSAEATRYKVTCPEYE